MFLTDNPLSSPEGYFAASLEERRQEFLGALAAKQVAGLVALRGGYGSNYLLAEELAQHLQTPKVLVGFSDVTSLQIFLWQRASWVTFYGPMVAAGLSAGAGEPGGYGEASLLNAVRKTDGGWKIPLRGEALVKGGAAGPVRCGAMSVAQGDVRTPG